VSNYRRWKVPGATYFFTLVTWRRRPILNARTIPILGDCLRAIRKARPFQTLAMVVLPEHVHCVWSLPPGDDDYSTRLRLVKRRFTSCWLSAGGEDSGDRDGRGEKGVWQRRFWEHLVRDEDDLERCCDYIHYNPVKHGHAARPGDWPWSTFLRFARAGHYADGWGEHEPASLAGNVDTFGE
jgi:putative transposase